MNNHMNIPKEWIEDIQSILFKHLPMFDIHLYHKSKFNLEEYNDEYIKKEINKSIHWWLILPFNENWQIPKGQEDNFKDFFIRIASHQLMKNMHPLTCGVNSNHDSLFPRINSNGDCLLVCSDCGYIQKY
jgi:hypothetical protein